MICNLYILFLVDIEAESYKYKRASKKRIDIN